ncbi:MAG: hypothetical protein CNLJKLNK_00718 [Holosporales bacterium]
MLSKYLDPKNDYAFKRIFGTEKNKNILIRFLNDVLSFKEGKPIVDITYLKTVQDPEISSKKTSVVDILCADELKNQYVVEMQVASEKGFVKRAQYYAAKAYCNQANVGARYYDLKEVIFLAITKFDMFPEKKEFKSDHIILDRKTHEHDLKDFSFTFLELPKFNKSQEDLETVTDKWMYFFKYAQDTGPEMIKKICEDNDVLKRAFQELDRAYWTEEELSTYEAALKKERDLEAAFEQQFDNGMAKGIELGEAKGIAKGMAKGVEIGKAEGIAEGERKAKLETAKNLESMGLSLKQIAVATGLDLDDLQKMKGQ